MSAERWSRLLQQDLIVSFYEADHKPAVILFLESCSIQGIQFTPIDTTSLAHLTLKLRDKEDEALAVLILFQHELQSSPVDDRERAMLRAVMNAREKSCSIEKLLSESSRTLCVAIQSSRPNNRLLELEEMLTQYSVVAPTQYISRLAWWLALCQRADRDSVLQTGNTNPVSNVADEGNEVMPSKGLTFFLLVHHPI